MLLFLLYIRTFLLWLDGTLLATKQKQSCQLISIRISDSAQIELATLWLPWICLHPLKVKWLQIFHFFYIYIHRQVNHHLGEKQKNTTRIQTHHYKWLVCCQHIHLVSPHQLIFTITNLPFPRNAPALWGSFGSRNPCSCLSISLLQILAIILVVWRKGKGRLVILPNP